ncbi:MAG: alpha/beta fold hydrolase [Anaerolineae bacterium]|nr:alpha/beta fold hydrolase [Anaerolineae bacterium]
MTKQTCGTSLKSGVLILHGFTSSLDCVNGLEAPIQALGIPTRMPILRGHGAVSPEALHGVTWPEWVADAEVALKDLLTKVDKVIVFGHSMGGLVTLTLAADHPDLIDSIVIAAAAIQLSSPLAPGNPLNFAAPLVLKIIKKHESVPVYADPALAPYDTNYRWAPTDAIMSLFKFMKATRRRLPEVRVPALILQSRKDSTVPPDTAEIIYREIATPPEQKRLAWFEVTEHEMFRDVEREATIKTVVDYVRERTGISA